VPDPTGARRHAAGALPVCIFGASPPLRPPVPSVASPPPTRAREAWLFALCLAVGGIASVLSGQDANWDLGNYHLYNPWAWLTGRYGFDLAPAQLQTYHNPLLDVPFYAMVAAGWPPPAIAFAMGLPAGAAGYFLVRIARTLLADAPAAMAGVAIAAAVAIGVTSAHGRAMLGTTMNEWHTTALVVAAFWLAMPSRDGRAAAAGSLAAAGLLVGLASGLKLTAATYAVAIAVALLARRELPSAVRDNLVFGVAVLVGMAVTLGPWMAWLHANTGNPLFPYFNDVFRSPLLPAEPILVPAYGPKTPGQWLAFPFAMWSPPAFYVSEARYRDARFPALAALAIVALVVALARRGVGRRGPAGPAGAARSWRFAIVFFVAAFLVWARLHGIYRYLLAAELLVGILIVALLLRVVPRRLLAGAIVAVALVLVFTTRPPSYGRVPYGPQFADVAVPAIEPGALVVLTADAPLAHVLPGFPADARHVGIESNIVRANKPTGMRARAAAIVDAHDGPIYQLTPLDTPALDVLAAYGLARAARDCAEVRSNLARAPIVLCRLERVRR
jgi:hypothetical protein